MSEVKEVLPFDSGAWGTGRWLDDNPLIHHVHLHNLPADFTDSWLGVQHQYSLMRDVSTHGFRTFGIDMARDYPGTDLYTDHCRKYCVEHVLGTGCTDPESGLVTLIAFQRQDISRPFTEAERALKETLFPHLREAARTNWLTHLPGAGGNQLGSQGVAVCDSSGLLLFAASSFLETIGREWPEWTRPFLPKEIVRTGPGQTYTGAAAVVAVSKMNELTVLRVRPVVPADKLSARELEIARRMSEGRDYKAIALDLNLSPSTIKTHTSKIYLKLGINDKAKIATELRKLVF